MYSDENFYGFGEKFTGNRRGQVIHCRQSDAPFHQHGALLPEHPLLYEQPGVLHPAEHLHRQRLRHGRGLRRLLRHGGGGQDAGLCDVLRPGLQGPAGKAPPSPAVPDDPGGSLPVDVRAQLPHPRREVGDRGPHPAGEEDPRGRHPYRRLAEDEQFWRVGVGLGALPQSPGHDPNPEGPALPPQLVDVALHPGGRRQL